MFSRETVVQEKGERPGTREKTGEKGGGLNFAMEETIAKFFLGLEKFFICGRSNNLLLSQKCAQYCHPNPIDELISAGGFPS